MLEHALVDIGVGVRWLREEAGETAVILGNSGGGSLMGAYQSQAISPNITASRDTQLPDAVMDLPAADLYVELNAHPGRPEVLTAWMDPSIVDEDDPLSVDTELDMYDPDIHTGRTTRRSSSRPTELHSEIATNESRSGRSPSSIGSDSPALTTALHHSPRVGRSSFPGFGD